jgi:hypothetical protein
MCTEAPSRLGVAALAEDFLKRLKNLCCLPGCVIVWFSVTSYSEKKKSFLEFITRQESQFCFPNLPDLKPKSLSEAILIQEPCPYPSWAPLHPFVVCYLGFQFSFHFWPRNFPEFLCSAIHLNERLQLSSLF